ncbi:hypothetical protein FHG87_021749 [Trinorchestia longiramus]|nr:hypothetical protein FHG87_021749 [Trinorchestia longiramus]
MVLSYLPSVVAGTTSESKTRLEFRYERKFYVDQSENKTTEMNTVMRLGPVTIGSTICNERSRSGTRAQPTTQYKEAATLFHRLYQALPRSTSPPRTFIT